MQRPTIPLAVFAVGLLSLAFTLRSAPPAPEQPVVATTSLAAPKWMTWEEAVAAQEQNPKHLLVDLYTDWCGWCKRMDETSWSDPEVSAYLEEHFYAVKFDAESKAPITYDGHTFEYQRTGRRGVHELAASLTDNRLTYPSVVYFNPAMERQMVSQGYKDAKGLLAELKAMVAKGG